MVTLIHGDNTAASRARLMQLKEKYSAAIHLDAKETNSSDVANHVQTDSLFSTERLLIIENLSTVKALQDNFPAIGPDIELLIWEKTTLTKAHLAALQKKFPQLQVEEFKIDPVVFKLVEALGPNNQKQLMTLWQRYTDQEIPEIALTMIIRQFRFLLLATEQKDSAPTDYQRLSSWQKSKLHQQSRLFTLEELKSNYQNLLLIDYQNKSGQSLYNLSLQIELFLLRL